MSAADGPTRTIVNNGTARRLMHPYLLEVNAGGRLRSRRIERTVARIGSRPESDVHVDDDTVSRLHAEIVIDDHGYRLRDLGSRNGTRVNGMRAADVYLQPEALIELGKSSLRFRCADEEVPIEASDGERFGPLLGSSLVMRELFSLLDKAAPADATVLVEGESGTGKELVAQALHARSKRATGPLVVFDCGSVSEALIESELFGHERGAFTGAEQRKAGLFEEAEGGTLFIDEIGELPLELQPKLLRVLEQRRVRRVGGAKELPCDVRVIAATNRELAREVNAGAFREDLFYRLAVITVRVPPLRERLDDLELLVRHFLDAACVDPGAATRAFAQIGAETWQRLRRHPFRGNLRELRNIVERAMILGDGGGLALEPQAGPRPDSAGSLPLEVDLERPMIEQKQQLAESFERRYLAAMLARHQGNISRAARGAGMDRMYFKRLMKKRGL